MKRGVFLRALVALPFAPSLITEARAPATKKFDRWAIYNNTATTLSDMMEYWSGGIRPLNARVENLARTGDAQKFAVIAQHPNGTWHRKTVLFSSCLLAVSTSRDLISEKAYQIAKRSREIARDWAFLKWGDDWRSHVPPYGRYPE
ncbi:MAG: hypothetical protein V3S55_10000 [Nitrospiraceae bacterium]